MNGRIWLESRPGRGSTFHVTLPFDVVETPARAVVAADESVLVGRSVLIVDDNATNRWILTDLVKRWGMRPTSVGNASAALTALSISLEKNEPFELALLDYQMPEVDGVELIRRVRTLPSAAGGGVPALAVSAHARRADRSRATDAGFDRHLSKPVDPNALVRAVAELAGRGPAAART